MEKELTASERTPGYPVYAAWLVALIATVGSLFFSEVMELPPCVLCWYQRIAMYPLVIVFGVGIVLRDRKLKSYALPVAFIGLAISVYHNLLYYGFIPESIMPCKQGFPARRCRSNGSDSSRFRFWRSRHLF